MQNAGPERNEMMSKDTFVQALQFAKDIGSRVVMISGGEPTSHPYFFEFLEEALNSDFFSVSVLSNGTFIKDHTFTEKFAAMVANRQGFFLQISSFKGLYANYYDVHKPNLKAIRLFNGKAIVCDEANEIQMKPLGRASSGKWYEEAKRLNCFPSCANSALIMAQSPKLGDVKIGALMERFRRFCVPMVSWDGSIRLGESEQCKVVANISEPLAAINKKMMAFRPCGGCDSYKWHFAAPSTEQEQYVCRLLWPTNKNSIIYESRRCSKAIRGL